MKVRAKQVGQYKGRTYDVGSTFEIEDGTYPVYQTENAAIVKDKAGKPIIIDQKSHLEHWMEKVTDDPKKPAPKPAITPSMEPDQGQKDQHEAEDLGLASRPKNP